MGFIEDRSYTIGRDGQIRINDPSLSRCHAEIKFIDGKIRLRDLCSVNGTYLVTNNKLIGISECYVAPGQRVIMGSKQYTVKALLAVVGIYVSYSNEIGMVIKSANPDEKTVTVKTDLDELVSHAISKLLD